MTRKTAKTTTITVSQKAMNSDSQRVRRSCVSSFYFCKKQVIAKLLPDSGYEMGVSQLSVTKKRQEEMI